MVDLTEAGDEPIPRRPAWVTELPLSAQQESIWSLCVRHPDSVAPQVFSVRRMRGPLVVDAWVRAVGAMVDRHESLRMRFVPRPGGPVQVVDPPAGLEVEFIDLSGAGEERARELLNERRRVEFDLERGRLVTSCLVRIAEDDHVWMMTVHHVVADGTALATVVRELGALYRAFVAGTEPALDPPVRYGDYLVWHKELAEHRLDADRRYWRERLAGVPILELRPGQPRPDRRGAPAAYVRHPIGAELSERVADLARTQRCTRFMVLLAACQILLAQHSGQRDFCFGVPVAGRTRSDLVPVVGLFANLLAMRCELPGDPSFREFLASTRESVLDALDHQELPFGFVAAELNSPPFQALFDFTEQADGAGPGLPGLRLEEFPLAIPKTLHDVVITVWPSPSGLLTRFAYDTALFEASVIEELAHRYEWILGTAVDHPEAPLSAMFGDRV
jgi:condensation domain-containing protein